MKVFEHIMSIWSGLSPEGVRIWFSIGENLKNNRAARGGDGEER